MWKRNVAVALTVVLTVASVAFGFSNHKQNVRLDALEQVRNVTSEEVETEIQRYLNANAVQFASQAAEENGIDMEDLINDSIGNVIEQTENGYLVSVKLTDEQSEKIASKVADAAYETLNQKVLSNKSTIDTAKLQKEVATAVTNTLANYLKDQDKEYVTVAGDTNAIVSQVLAKLNADGIGNSNSSESSTEMAMSKEQIEALVKEIVNNSSVSKDNVNSFKESIINSTVDYLRQYNLLTAGKDGKDGIDGKAGKDGKDGEDGITPQKGIDYFTEKDIQSMSETILNTITKDGLNVYGTQGVGIYGAEIDDSTGELTFTLHDGELDENGDYKNVDKVTVEGFTNGNGIKYMNIEDNGNNSYNVYYYTEYKTSNGNTGKPTAKYVVDREGGDIVGVHKYDSSVDGSDAETVYQYNAGTLSVSAETIEGIIGSATNTIITTLNTELGSEAGQIVASLEGVQNAIENLTESINGKVQDDGTKINGISSLTSGKTTTNEADGSQTVTWDENTFGWTAEKLNLMMGENGGGDSSVSQLKEQAEKIESLGKFNESTQIEITTSDIQSAVLDENYFIVEKSVTGLINKYPDFSWIGTSDADTVPSNEQARIESFCKFIKVKTATSKDTDGTVTFYFATEGNNKIAPNSSIFIELRSITLNNQGTGILTNQTTDNYGYIRQVGAIVNENGQNRVEYRGGYLADNNGQTVLSVNAGN